MEARRISGCCIFCLRNGMRAEYIPFNCHSSRGSCRSKWFYLHVDDYPASLGILSEKLEKIPSWMSKPSLTASLKIIVDKNHSLREQGLLGYELGEDFKCRRILPLQA